MQIPFDSLMEVWSYQKAVHLKQAPSFSDRTLGELAATAIAIDGGGAGGCDRISAIQRDSVEIPWEFGIQKENNPKFQHPGFTFFELKLGSNWLGLTCRRTVRETRRVTAAEASMWNFWCASIPDSNGFHSVQQETENPPSWASIFALHKEGPPGLIFLWSIHSSLHSARPPIRLQLCVASCNIREINTRKT